VPKIVKGLLWGGLAGCLLVAPDGVLMGAVTGNFWTWFGCAAVVGTLLGMLVGGLAVKLGPRLVLKPPPDEENQAIDSPA
jgi:hypothetical protein